MPSRPPRPQPITVAGIRGAVVDSGTDGPPLALIVSPFSTAAVYRPTSLALAAHGFRVRTIELPGSGEFGSPLGGAWGLADYARWTAGCVAALGLSGVTLVGHSHSAAMALHLAAGAPPGAERIARVVLANAVGAGGPRTVIETLAGCAVCLPMEVRFVARSVPHLAGNLLRHGRDFWRQLAVASRADVEQVARRVTTPALLAWGVHDYVEPPRTLARLRRWMPRAAVYRSARGSHDWLIERAGEFAAAVAAFAAGPAAPAPSR